MVNLEAVVLGAVELCCITLRGVSNILSVSTILFISQRVDNIFEAATSKMTVKLNEDLCKAVSAETEHYNFSKIGL